MKTQKHLSELDATKLANFKLRQDILNREVQAFFAELMTTYGNPGEALAVGPDNALIRTPPAPPARPNKRRG